MFDFLSLSWISMPAPSDMEVGFNCIIFLLLVLLIQTSFASLSKQWGAQKAEPRQKAESKDDSSRQHLPSFYSFDLPVSFLASPFKLAPSFRHQRRNKLIELLNGQRAKRERDSGDINDKEASRRNGKRAKQAGEQNRHVLQQSPQDKTLVLTRSTLAKHTKSQTSNLPPFSNPKRGKENRPVASR